MTNRVFALAAVLALGLSGAAAAQGIDFGADSSPWANDGECDDPRFQGQGMTNTPLLDSDIGADATDCRNAYNAGTVTLAGGGDAVAAPGGKAPPGQVVQPVTTQGINFGDDSGDWPNDGECDDRRFIGPGTAGSFSHANVGRDATDCRRLHEAGQITLWDFNAARAATQCAAIDFGDDSGGYADDSDCDDPRFDGPASAFILRPDFLRRDATDCRRMCDLGMIALRDF